MSTRCFGNVHHQRVNVSETKTFSACMKLTSASHPRPCALRVGCLDCRILSKVGTVGPKGEIKPSFQIFRFSFPSLESFAEFGPCKSSLILQTIPSMVYIGTP